MNVPLEHDADIAGELHRCKRLDNSFDKERGDFYGFAPFAAGVVAQLVEHHNGIVGVRGSNPLGSTSLFFIYELGFTIYERPA